MPSQPYQYEFRTSVAMTEGMRQRLDQTVTARQDPRFTRADAIREAIRLYLDQQADLIGSQKHFRRSLTQQLNDHENRLTLLLYALLWLQARLFAFLINRATQDEVKPQTLLQSALREAQQTTEQLKTFLAALPEKKG